MSFPTPKLFVSYSWTDQEHMDWVVRLATELRANGVSTILDKWHLREGQDAHAFMEQMVTDPEVSKVILICDGTYVERADRRVGGVGAESQIMSGELYGKVDQTKFVAVCRENDANGRALIPAFMRSRIYIDFTNDDLYSDRFEQLLRWCFDKPFFVEPEIGTPPIFLDETVSPVLRRHAEFARVGQGKAGLSTVPLAVTDFFRKISNEEALPKINSIEGAFRDEEVYQSILGLSPLLSRVLEVFEKAVRVDGASEIAGEEMHRYLEFVLSKYDAKLNSGNGDVLKFYGQFVLVASVAILLDNSRGGLADDLLATPFVIDEYGGVTAKAVTFSRLGAFLRSLETRNDRLQLRRLSLHADLIQQVCETAGFSFRNFMQADLAIYLRSIITGDRWWPDSLLYATDCSGAMPLYIRAVKPRYRTSVLGTSGISSKLILDDLIENLKSGKIKKLDWSRGWSSVDILELANLEAISNSWSS